VAFLETYTRAQFREIAVEEYNAEATVPVATDAGSGLGSFFDGDSLLAVVEQRQIIYLSLIARLATIPANSDGSPNPDVDTFCSPFIGPRLGQQAATGPATFSCPSNVSTQVVVAVGTVVQAQSTGLLYAVIANTANAAYSALLNGYPINAGQSSVTATVQCQTSGVVGNAQIGQVNALYGGPGQVTVPAAITTVSNPAAYDNGSPYESDAQYKTRFTLRMATGQGGTLWAMASALLGISPSTTWAIADTKNASGVTTPSYFTAVVATLGQTGPTSATVLGQATTALEGTQSINGAAPTILPTRPAGITYAVIGPAILTVGASAVITYAAGFSSAIVQANCVTAVAQFIAEIGLPGLAATTTLAYLKIASILYAVPGVAQVDNLVLTLNSTNYTTDLTATFAQMFAAGAMTFTMVA